VVLDDIARLRAAGIANINVDLIAGLPHQTAESWERSLADVIATDVPHISVYMLEVDEDSRLGRELIAGGTRYHAHFVPDSDLTADLYVTACERLETASVRQYEISNFARDGAESKHNLKYWTRQPYLGFGVDAHSMIMPRAELRTADVDAVRYAWPDSLEAFLNENEHRPAREAVSVHGALEETFFVGLRLNRGVDLEDVARQYGKSALDRFSDTISDLRDLGVLEQDGNRLRLTGRGRLLSNEVFERFVTGVTEEPTRATSEDEPDAPLVQIRAGSH
jgi:oxygen-independent coproporphyrinogen-3 oxidase